VFGDAAFFGFCKAALAATPQKARRGTLEQLDIQIVGQQLAQINHPFFQQTGYAIAHHLSAAAFAALKYACKACVDDRSRAAGLSHDSIFTHDDFSFLLCSVSAFILLQMQ
jgi:hypothetical protein